MKQIKERLVSLIVSATLMTALLPAVAFAAIPVASSTGPINGYYYDGSYNVGNSVAEIHSDAYANGFSYLKGNATALTSFQPGRYTERTFLYFVATPNDKYLMTSGSKTNTDWLPINTYLVNQIWAPMQPIIRVETTNIVNAQDGSGSKLFGTYADLAYNPGPTPRSAVTQGNGNTPTIKGANEQGLSYGSGGDLYNPEGQPDLIGVIGVNGEKGYIYYKDFYDIIKCELNLSPEEAVSRFTARDEKIATQLANVISDHYGAPVISQKEAKTFISLLSSGQTAEEIAKTLTIEAEEYSTSGISLFGESNQELTGDDFRTLYDDAKEKACTMLPVYKSDGVTQIDQFVMDAI